MGEDRLDQGEQPVTLRIGFRGGDIDSIVHLHGVNYAREYGFDHTFEAYVAGPLSKFARSASKRERIWLAERDCRIVGCIAITAASPDVAQLRWFLVDSSARGIGLGKRLLNEAVGFCKTSGYTSIILWTVSALDVAARLYRSVGFKKVAKKAGEQWGVDVVEEKYELRL